MSTRNKALKIILNSFFFFAMLTEISRADGNDRGMEAVLQKIPPKCMVSRTLMRGARGRRGRRG